MGSIVRRRRVACLLLIAAALLIALRIEGARAATKTFTGCVTSNGALYRVAIASAPTTPCGATDTQVSWTSTGPTGDPGPTGSPGAIGVAPCPAGEAFSGFDANGGI